MNTHSGLWHDFQLYAGAVPEATNALHKTALVVSGRLRLPLASPV